MATKPLPKGKKIKAYVKLNLPAGKATPAPPVGPALGQHGVPLINFCKEFNDRTQKMGDDLIPVVITIFEDRSFTFITKSPITSSLILKALKQQKGSGEPNKSKIGKLTKKQVEEIAQIKMPDLNARSLEQAVKVVAGTAESMGVEVEQ